MSTHLSVSAWWSNAWGRGEGLDALLIMMSYTDGSEVRTGDLVSLHFRTYTGVVQHIIDLPSEIKA